MQIVLNLRNSSSDVYFSVANINPTKQKHKPNKKSVDLFFLFLFFLMLNTLPFDLI